jgi:hypothetical protein
VSLKSRNQDVLEVGCFMGDLLPFFASLKALSPSTLGLVSSLILATLVLGRVFKLSLKFAFLAALAPVLAPLQELPFIAKFSMLPHEYLVAAAWVLMFILGIAWLLCRPVCSKALTTFGGIRLMYILALAVSAAVAVLLVFNPRYLSENLPSGWKYTLGYLLLAVAIFSASRAVWSLIRATFLVAVWGAVSAVLASSIFLDKLPHEVVWGDVIYAKRVIEEGSALTWISDAFADRVR